MGPEVVKTIGRKKFARIISVALTLLVAYGAFEYGMSFVSGLAAIGASVALLLVAIDYLGRRRNCAAKSNSKVGLHTA